MTHKGWYGVKQGRINQQINNVCYFNLFLLLYHQIIFAI